MLKTLLIALISILFCFSILQNSFAADPPMPKPVGRVIWVKGDFTATMENQEKRSLQKMSIIYLHDILETGKETQAQIAFTDNTLMTFSAETKFVIDDYAYQPKAGKKSVGKFIMDLIQGGFRTITGIIAKDAPTEYKVNTPVATIGVRGTDYAAYFRDGKLYVGWIKGTPCVKNKTHEICLNQYTRYVRIDGEDSAPVPLGEAPEFLGEDLYIEEYKISPFGETFSGSRQQNRLNGPISNFCISY